MKYIEDTPVIFLTAKVNLDDKIVGLTSGAEDYIVKPFEIMELIARINIVLRRYRENDNSFTFQNVKIDFDKKEVFYQGKPANLKPQEYTLLEVLVNNRNLALSREKLLELAWGYDFVGDTRTVDEKLGLEEQIKTVYKMGYRLEV